MTFIDEFIFIENHIFIKGILLSNFKKTTSSYYF